MLLPWNLKSQSLVMFEMLNVSTKQEQQYFNVSSWYSSAI